MGEVASWRGHPGGGGRQPPPWHCAEATSGHARCGALPLPRSWALSRPPPTGSGVRRWFPILTSASDDLSAREARASRPAGGRGRRRARAEEGGVAAGEHAPIRQPQPMGAVCGSPASASGMKGAARGESGQNPERRPDHPRPNNTPTSPAARHEPREENRHAPRDRRRRGLPLQSPEDAGLCERAETQGVQQGAPGRTDR